MPTVVDQGNILASTKFVLFATVQEKTMCLPITFDASIAAARGSTQENMRFVPHAPELALLNHPVLVERVCLTRRIQTTPNSAPDPQR